MVDENIVWAIGVLVAVVVAAIVLGAAMIIHQWHFASAACEWLL